MTVDMSDSLQDLTDSQKTLLLKLRDDLGQAHLFEGNPKTLASLAKQLEQLDEAYTDGGLEGYIQNARRLLENSAKGVNPLEGWKPSVPKGECLELGTDEYKETEKEGLCELGNTGFVLVAGGLGERLGYGGIKVSISIGVFVKTLSMSCTFYSHMCRL
jgi:UDP-sugar pyrophosphorylase